MRWGCRAGAMFDANWNYRGKNEPARGSWVILRFQRTNRSLGLLCCNEVVVASLVQRILRESWFHAEIRCAPENLINQITRVTLAQRLLKLLRNDLNEVIRQSRFALDHAHLALGPKDFHKLLRHGVRHADLVRNSSNERLVAKLARVNVG